MADEKLVVCSDCKNYEPGHYGGHVPARCEARDKNLPPTWVYNKPHKCPTDQFEPRK